MKPQIFLLAVLILPLFIQAQKNAVWSEADRTYLIERLTTSIDNLKKETSNLTEAQWNFKPEPSRWSINQIIEHIGIWELLLQREVSQDLAMPANPTMKETARDDSSFYKFIYEEKPHITNESTKPFTFAQPTGYNRGIDNLRHLETMRTEAIEFVKTTDKDLRAYFLKPGRGSIHQVFITTFGHADRHLRQILKNKADPRYPK